LKKRREKREEEKEEKGREGRKKKSDGGGEQPKGKGAAGSPDQWVQRLGNRQGVSLQYSKNIVSY